ncbi:MAG: stage III sporulation protein AF [Clostridia bacterium]|nr:stage III sporulation protein AF [Clostridia bacterium]
MIVHLAGYFISLIAAAMLVAVAQSMIPSEKIRKISALTGGALLLLCVLTPLLSLDEVRLNIDFSDFLADSSGSIAQMQAESDAKLDALIKQKTAEYISDKASELGAQVSTEVKTARAEEGYFYPCGVTVTGVLSASQENELSAYLADVLSIPKERQVFHTR